MKKAFEKIKALADELQESDLEHNEGCFVIIASDGRHSDDGVISVYGTPDDIGCAMVGFMLSDERSAMAVRKAVQVYDKFIEEKEAQAKKNKPIPSKKHLS